MHSLMTPAPFTGGKRRTHKKKHMKKSRKNRRSKSRRGTRKMFFGLF